MRDFDKTVDALAEAMCDGDWHARDFMETLDGCDPEDVKGYWRDKAIIAIRLLEAIELDSTYPPGLR